MVKHKYEIVYDYILDLISSNELSVGDFLPTDIELCSRLDVSVITVKKAFEMLVSDGIVTRKSGSKTRVKSLPNQKRFVSLIIEESSEQFGVTLVRTFEKICYALGYTPLVSRTLGQKEQENIAINAHVSLDTAGIILMPIQGQHSSAIVEKLWKMKYPLVTIDRRSSGIRTYHVESSFEKAVNDMILDMQKKYKKVIIISTPLKISTTISQRIDLVCDCCDILNFEYEIHFFDEKRNKMRAEKYLQDISDNHAILFIKYDLVAYLFDEISSNNIYMQSYTFDYPQNFKDNKMSYIYQDEEKIMSEAFNLLLTLSKNPLLSKSDKTMYIDSSFRLQEK